MKFLPNEPTLEVPSYRLSCCHLLRLATEALGPSISDSKGPKLEVLAITENGMFV